MQTVVDEMPIFPDDSDYHRGQKLAGVSTGSGHDCFLKGIIVQFDMEAPAYVWQQAQRYHWFEIVSSQSKMHRVLKMDLRQQCTPNVDSRILAICEEYIEAYLKCPFPAAFENILANLPHGFQLTAGISTNMLQLKTMYFQRRSHRLRFWNEVFVEWLETLPYFKEWIMNREKDANI